MHTYKVVLTLPPDGVFVLFRGIVCWFWFLFIADCCCCCCCHVTFFSDFHTIKQLLLSSMLTTFIFILITTINVVINRFTVVLLTSGKPTSISNKETLTTTATATATNCYAFPRFFIVMFVPLHYFPHSFEDDSIPHFVHQSIATHNIRLPAEPWLILSVLQHNNALRVCVCVCWYRWECQCELYRAKCFASATTYGICCRTIVDISMLLMFLHRFFYFRKIENMYLC